MKVEDLQRQWETFGARDPMWAVLTDGTDAEGRWSADEFFATGREDVERWMSRLRHLGLPTSGARALDFGCGVGRLTQALAAHFDRVVGIDVSRPMLDAAERHNSLRDRVTFAHNTTDDLRAFPGAHFDLVLSHIVLQHLPAHLGVRYVDEFLRVLAPGGTAVFQVPTARIGGRARYALSKRFPALARAYRRIRFGAAPHMEMNVIPRRTIEGIASAARARIAAADPDTAAGPQFESTTFYVHKPA